MNHPYDLEQRQEARHQELISTIRNAVFWVAILLLYIFYYSRH